MDKNSEKVFVTGGAGLVGKELILQLLDRGYSVRALYHHTGIDIEHPQLEFFEGDILDVVSLEDALKGIHYVFHCAALVSYDPSDRDRLMKINVEGTANVVNACVDEGVKQLIHVSSVAAVGYAPQGKKANESMQWSGKANKGNYSKSKFLAEMEVWRGAGEGLPVAIVNPSIILGGDNWDTGSSAIFKSVYNDFPWYSTGVTGFVDVHDVASVMILLMEHGISGERFILNGENLSYKQVFSWVAQYFGKKPPSRKVTPFLAEVVWRLEQMKSALTGKKRLITKETARKSFAKIYYDNSKILAALPDFRFTPIEETIERTCHTLQKKYSK